MANVTVPINVIDSESGEIDPELSFSLSLEYVTGKSLQVLGSLQTSIDDVITMLVSQAARDGDKEAAEYVAKNVSVADPQEAYKSAALEALNVVELRKIAVQKGVKNGSRMSKAKLIKSIQEAVA